ncbi:plasma membrane-associated coenzyme Q6 reductase Pga3p [Monosporozyma servazzii]
MSAQLSAAAAHVDEEYNILNEPLHGIVIPTCLFLVGVTILTYLSQDYRILLTLPILFSFLAFKWVRSFKRKQSLFQNKWTPLELEDQTLISKNTAIYRFNLKTHLESLNIPVGYHVAARCMIDGKEEVRFYNPINPKFDQGHLDIIVKSYPEGTVSKRFASLVPGEFVDFRGPIGLLNYAPNSSKKIGIVVGGSGITPALQLLNEVITTPEDLTQVSLIYCNDTEKDILLKDELDEMDEKYPYLDIHYVVRYPQNPETWTGEVGLITKEIMQKYLPEPSSDNRLLICGPEAMDSLVLRYSRELGWEHNEKTSGDDQVFVF